MCRSKVYWLVWGAVGFALLVPKTVVGGVLSFSDGGMWVFQQRRISWTPNDQGEWNTAAAWLGDGSLQLKVDGPYTGNSYGGVASARTIKDFNDGQSWVINFRRSVTVPDGHENGEYIQITNGYFPTFEEDNWHASWLGIEPPGTTNLLYFSSHPFLRWQDYVSSPAQNWSITLDPMTHTGRLFDGPNGTGSLRGERSLDPNQAWYLRFMINDATSAGFGASQMQLDIGDVSAQAVPEPGTMGLVVTAAGLGLIGLAWRRKSLL